MTKRAVPVFLSIGLLIGPLVPLGWATTYSMLCDVREIAFSPSDPDLGIAITSWGTLLTRDGEHWTELTDVEGSRVVFDPRSSRIYLATTSGHLEVSEDRGKTWRAFSDQFEGLRITALAVDPTAPETIYAGIQGKSVFRSADGGETWQRIYNGIDLRCPWQILVGPYNRDIYVVSNCSGSCIVSDERMGVFHSSNGGEDWDLVQDLKGSVISAIAPVSKFPAIYIAGQNPGVLHRTDRSPTSNALSSPMPASIYAIWAVPESDVVYIGTREGLYRQSDRERSKLLEGTVLAVTVPRGRPDALYVSTSETGILYSLDRGKTWRTGALCPEAEQVP